MPTYTFTVELQGTGHSQEEAWIDAVDSFASEPGEPIDIYQEEEDEYENEYQLNDDDTDSSD